MACFETHFQSGYNKTPGYKVPPPPTYHLRSCITPALKSGSLRYISVLGHVRKYLPLRNAPLNVACPRWVTSILLLCAVLVIMTCPSCCSDSSDVSSSFSMSTDCEGDCTNSRVFCMNRLSSSTVEQSCLRNERRKANIFINTDIKA